MRIPLACPSRRPRPTHAAAPRWARWRDPTDSCPAGSRADPGRRSPRDGDVHDERPMVGRLLRVDEVRAAHGVRLRADDAASPDVIDALLRVVAGRRVARARAEVVEAPLIQELDLDVTGLRVEVTGDDQRRSRLHLPDDRAHLFLA